MIEAALHVTVTAAIAAIFLFARHGFGSWSTALPIALVAVASGRLVAVGWRMRVKTARTGAALTQAGVLGAMVLGGLVFALPPSAVSASVAGDVKRYYTVDELLTTRDMSGEVIVRGHVQAGSIFKREAGAQMDWKFTLRGEQLKIDVRYSGVVPDVFRDDVECAVTGHVGRDEKGRLILEATDLVAKCPSRYEGAKPGDTTYH